MSSALIRFSFQNSFDAFTQSCANLEAAQSESWGEVLEALRGGSFWGGRLERKLEEFPLSSYQDYRPALVEAWKREQQSPFTGAPILFWAKSSGTTEVGHGKVFPVTEIYLKSLRRIYPPYFFFLAQRFEHFFSEPVLYFTSLFPHARTAAGIERGSLIDGTEYKSIPPYFREKKFALPVELFGDAQLFSEWAPLYALATDLSGILTVSALSVEPFMKGIEERFTFFLQILAGTPPRVVAPGLPPLSIKEGRLKYLKTLNPRNLSFQKLWPSLEFISTWKTGTGGLQIERIRKWMDASLPVVDCPYSATEGWFTVPMGTERPGGVLHPSSGIVEFIPAGLGSPALAQLRKPWELEAGELYEVLVTNTLGLVRYRIGDIVRCTGHFHQSPVLEFYERANHAISFTQCHVSEAHVLAALREGEVSFLGRWFFAPSTDGRHLCFCHDRSDPGLAAKLARFEKALEKIYNPYSVSLHSNGLSPLRAILVLPDHSIWRELGIRKRKVIHQRPVRTTGC